MDTWYRHPLYSSRNFDSTDESLLILLRNNAIREDYKALVSLYPQFETLCSLEEFKWARMCVCSRNFGMTINGVKTAALVPYADMLNHHRPRQSKWQFEDDSQSFQCYSCGHQVMFELTLQPPPTGVSATALSEGEDLYATGGADLFEYKSALWRREGNGPTRRVRVCVSDGEPTKMLFALLRIITADQDDYFELVANRGGGGYRSSRNAYEPVSIHNEITTLLAMKKLCDRMLSLYPSSLEHDVDLLRPENVANAPLYSNYRNAVIHVKGEKEVLHHFRKLSVAGLQLLQFTQEEEMRFVADLKEIRSSEHQLIYQYCNTSIAGIRRAEFQRIEKTKKNLDLSKSMVV
ncbi:unnamed protein product [Sphagnum jensenii]